jgi:hypothetical protein
MGVSFVKLISGANRARRVLLGALVISVGALTLANKFRKYSNPDLRYPTLKKKSIIKKTETRVLFTRAFPY